MSIPKTSPQVNLIRRPSLAQMGIPMPNAVNVQRTASMSMPPNEMGFNPYAQQMMPPQMMPNSMLGSQQAVNMQNYDMVRPSNMQPPNMGPGGPGMVSPHNMLPQQSFSPNLPCYLNSNYCTSPSSLHIPFSCWFPYCPTYWT